jgi:cephalosporin hydroxylase
MAFRVGAIVAIALLSGLNVYQYVWAHETTDATPSDKEVIERFYHLYYAPSVWHDAKWLGIETWQNPNDAWIHQEIIVETKPDFIIECGTHKGGSALLWAMILQQVNPAGRVITIDIEDLSGPARKSPLWAERIGHFIGSSTDPKIVAEIAQRVRGKKVLVILDSNHEKAHVLAELRLYSPLVQVGGYLIVQDTVLHGHPLAKEFPEGPMEAVKEFLASTRDFEVDAKRERYIVTFHPQGYLKRVR